jgi:large subunit ribosomal protein L23
MMEEFKIIRKPILTEKAMALKDSSNQLVFEVDPAGNKCEIKKAVEKRFKVTVLAVRTQNRMGKPKRVGKNTGRRKHWKKAIVTLKQGDKIDYFEGV